MGLMHLLTVGHSLTGVKNTPSPYRYSGCDWLPKFAESEPDESPPVCAANPATRKMACHSAALLETRDFNSDSGVNGFTQSVFPNLFSPGPEAPVVTPGRPPVARRLKRLAWPAWMLSQAVVQAGKQRRPRVAGGQAVRVIRNDLSLSDLEVVAGAGAHQSACHRIFKAVGAAKSGPSQAWNWLATRLFKSGGLRI